MALVLTGAPAIEPVTLDEAKAHLRAGGTLEDVLVSSLVLTSRLQIEAALDVAMIDQSWTLQLDRWPRRSEVEIPLSPLKGVTNVRVRDASGAWQDVPATAYLTDIASRPPRIVFHGGAARPQPGVPAAGIEITFTAGFGATAASVPAPLKHAILLLTAHWYENREAAGARAAGVRMPDAVSDLIAPFRKIRL